MGDRKLTHATCWQSKTIEVSAEALHKGSDPALPPLMNPTMLEASDDLTNLSHLNEPAGMPFAIAKLPPAALLFALPVD